MLGYERVSVCDGCWSRRQIKAGVKALFLLTNIMLGLHNHLVCVYVATLLYSFISVPHSVIQAEPLNSLATLTHQTLKILNLKSLLTFCLPLFLYPSLFPIH